MYDLKKIKSIPCGEVAQKYGIQLKKKHNRLWGKLRPEEKVASFSINLKNNLWYDFGSGKGGSVIDLVAEIEGISAAEAIHKLAKEYGIENIKKQGWSPLTDNQYRELGIQPERATMNFKFDLNKHSVEQLRRWEQKYGMPVKELAIKYPNVYNKMVIKIAMKNINLLRETYYSNLKDYHNPSTDKASRLFLKTVSKQYAEELNRKIFLLEKAVTTKDNNFSKLTVSYEKDFEDITKTLNEDEKIRQRIIRIYKKIFNYKYADYFTTEQAKALYDINKTLSSGANNKFLPISAIEKLYKMLGKDLVKLEQEYNKIINKNINNAKLDKLKDELSKTKKLFEKCDIVINGITKNNLNIHNKSLLEQKNNPKQLQKSTFDLSL